MTRARLHECFNEKRAAECRLRIYTYIHIYIDITPRAATEPEDLCLIRPELFIYARTSVFGMRWKDYRDVYVIIARQICQQTVMPLRVRYPLFVCRIRAGTKIAILYPSDPPRYFYFYSIIIIFFHRFTFPRLIRNLITNYVIIKHASCDKS